MINAHPTEHRMAGQAKSRIRAKRYYHYSECTTVQDMLAGLQVLPSGRGAAGLRGRLMLLFRVKFSTTPWIVVGGELCRTCLPGGLAASAHEEHEPASTCWSGPVKVP